jgi:hypothetical protein
MLHAEVGAETDGRSPARSTGLVLALHECKQRLRLGKQKVAPLHQRCTVAPALQAANGTVGAFGAPDLFAATALFIRDLGLFSAVRLRRSVMTVAQHEPTLHHSAGHRRMRDAAVWRSIGIGAGFAATGLAMMASAFIG